MHFLFYKYPNWKQKENEHRILKSLEIEMINS